MVEVDQPCRMEMSSGEIGRHLCWISGHGNFQTFQIQSSKPTQATPRVLGSCSPPGRTVVLQVGNDGHGK